MGNIIKSESFFRANIENAIWYVMKEEDLKDIPNPSFGTKAYIITTQKQKICRMLHAGRTYLFLLSARRTL